MKTITIILPNQLFDKNKLINNNEIYLVEHPKFFTQYKYHKLKIILHRASMKAYFDNINSSKKHYVTFDKYEMMNKIIQNNNIEMYDPVDFDIIQEYNKALDIKIHDTPMFLCSNSSLINFVENNKVNHANFYKWQRIRLNILVNNGEPVGGQWSFDKDNRIPYPANGIVDMELNGLDDEYVIEAKKYVKKYFSNNPGSDEVFYIPYTTRLAKKHLDVFIKNRLVDFGKYEDATHPDMVVGNHSLLSPMMNIGIIEPSYVISRVLAWYTKKNLHTVEGFIRQVIGWREYVRLIYCTQHALMNKKNYFGNKQKLGRVWYTNKSMDNYILDTVRMRVWNYGYAHHIERLMILGSWMLITQVNPKHVYVWFLCMFVDAYEWVMEPNIYGMSQYSVGDGIMMKRPYFCSSNYLLKMSRNNWRDTWEQEWNTYYKKFILKHKNIFKKVYSLASIVNRLEK